MYSKPSDCELFRELFERSMIFHKMSLISNYLWSLLKIKALGVLSYENQSPNLATLAGEPDILKISLK
jgi:hypothetical protein